MVSHTFTPAENQLLETHLPLHWGVEDGYLDHPIGDRLVRNAAGGYTLTEENSFPDLAAALSHMAKGGRNFTTTEQCDIECHHLAANGFLLVGDEAVETRVGHRLTPIGDNLYSLYWCVGETEHEIRFTSLAAALARLEDF